MKYLASFVLALSLAISTLAAAADYASEQERLEALRERIAEIESRLAEQRQHRRGARAELSRAEEQVAATAEKLSVVRRQREQKRAQVTALRRDYEAQEAQAARHRQVLAEQIRRAYVSGEQDYLRLLLAQDDPAELDRMMAYYGYLNAARSAEIREAAEHLQHLAQTRRSLDTELERLEALEARAREEQKTLTALRERRSRELAKLEAEIAADDRRLADLRADASALEDVLESLRQALDDIGDSDIARVPFESRRGKLDWPLEGAVAARFGAPRGVGDLRWAGLLIQGDYGDPVRAVAHGHVVFADWLRGFGLLIIVDHGDGFMSLYGHNEAIYKETGDWVAPGEILATVGASGGRREPALYFEIRAAGEPVDPVRWLSAR